MEDNQVLEIQTSRLKKTYINHLWVFPIISIINLVLFIKMYFISIIYYSFYIICEFIYFIFIFIPIYPFELLKKNLFYKNVNLLAKISFIHIFIMVFFAILINLITLLNIWGLFSFYKECPYNFSYNDIAKIFNIEYNENKINNTIINTSNSDKCDDNRCILMTENSNAGNFFYLCNFDSSYDFQSINNKIAKTFFFTDINKDNNSEIICNEFTEEEFNYQENYIEDKIESFIIQSYFYICSNYKDFYKCIRHEKPKKYNNIDYDFSCPDISDNFLYIFIEIIAFIFNIVLSLVLIVFEYLTYIKILKLLNVPRINPAGASTRGNTHSLSQNPTNNNESNNNEVNSQTIIIEGNSNRKEEIKINNEINDINIINNEAVLTINKFNNDKDIQINDIDNSERKNKLININDINARNETAINYNTFNTGDSINYQQIDNNNTNDNNIINIHKKE